MRVKRDLALAVTRGLDNWVPPVLRDRRWFMAPLARLLLRDKAEVFLDFKDRAFAMTPEEFAGVYRSIADVASMQGETDLNERCVEAILAAVVGDSVVDIGCGRGYLASRLREVSATVTGCDIVVGDELRVPGVTFVAGNVEALPFANGEFDTVVCTHTLEHVQRFPEAVAELRRVAARRLIVVVPRQRPYRYTFNLHLHFFPYPWSLIGALGSRPGARLDDLGDWFYVEDL
jgi:ubiquinone/menaquinone biosynthesis C-methylase UbiE